MKVSPLFIVVNVDRENLSQVMNPRNKFLSERIVDDQNNSVLARNQVQIVFGLVDGLQHFDVVDRCPQTLQNVDKFSRIDNRWVEPQN